MSWSQSAKGMRGDVADTIVQAIRKSAEYDPSLKEMAEAVATATRLLIESSPLEQVSVSCSGHITAGIGLTSFSFNLGAHVPSPNDQFIKPAPPIT